MPPRIVSEPRHRRPTSRSGTTIVETIEPPPPPVSVLPDPGFHDTRIVQDAPHSSDIVTTSGSGFVKHGDHWDRISPRTSLVSTRSRDYYVDSASQAGRSPRGSIRYIEPRGSAKMIDRPSSSGHGVRQNIEKREYGMPDERQRHRHPARRSGSVAHVNPRSSTASHRSGRSTREKVVVVNRYGDKSYY